MPYYGKRNFYLDSAAAGATRVLAPALHCIYSRLRFPVYHACKDGDYYQRCRSRAHSKCHGDFRRCHESESSRRTCDGRAYHCSVFSCGSLHRLNLAVRCSRNLYAVRQTQYCDSTRGRKATASGGYRLWVSVHQSQQTSDGLSSLWPGTHVSRDAVSKSISHARGTKLANGRNRHRYSHGRRRRWRRTGFDLDRKAWRQVREAAVNVCNGHKLCSVAGRVYPDKYFLPCVAAPCPSEPLR